MSGEIVRLGPGACPDIESGARLFAAAAYPAPEDAIVRQHAVAAWVGGALQELNRSQGTTELFADDTLNDFANLTPVWCDERRRLSLRQLRKRAFAAQAVRPWVRELLGDPQPLPKGITKFSQRQISLYLHNSYFQEADHFQERVLRPSRPGIHIAIAFDYMLCLYGGELSEFPVPLDDIGLFEVLVERANQFAIVVSLDKRFKVDRERQIHLKWVA